MCADTDNDGAIQWDELRGPIKATKAKGTKKGARGRDLTKARVLATANGGVRRGASSREHRHFPLA